MEERQKNQSLEIALLEYQNELKESYKIIIELRYHIKKLGFLIQLSQQCPNDIFFTGKPCQNHNLLSRLKQTDINRMVIKALTNQ